MFRTEAGRLERLRASLRHDRCQPGVDPRFEAQLQGRRSWCLLPAVPPRGWDPGLRRLHTEALAHLSFTRSTGETRSLALHFLSWACSSALTEHVASHVSVLEK